MEETKQPVQEVSSKDILNIWLHHEDSQGRSYFYNSITKKSQWVLPEGENDWLQCKDEQGKVFFHNALNDVSIWEHPSTYGSTNWIECIDKDSGRTFFYNVRERKSVWTRPGGTADVQQKVTHGAGVAAAKIASSRNVAASFSSDNGEEHVMQEKDGRSGAAELTGGMEEESKRSDSQDSSSSEGFTLAPIPDVEFHDYVLKEGGGTTMFGRKSWKRRFFVLKDGQVGWFRSFKDYMSGTAPLKDRWIDLAAYRMEESLSDPLGVRLLPVSVESADRIWNLRCESGEKKAKLMEAIAPFVVTKGFVKSLDRHLSGRRFLTDSQ